MLVTTNAKYVIKLNKKETVFGFVYIKNVMLMSIKFALIAGELVKGFLLKTNKLNNSIFKEIEDFLQLLRMKMIAVMMKNIYIIN